MAYCFLQKEHITKTILVTGGAGFIGSHLCEYLLNKDHKNKVICLDNFFTGSKDNIQHLLSNKNFEILRHDIIQQIYLEVDQIYNLACPASPVHYQWDPIKTLLTSNVGMYNILGIAKRCIFLLKKLNKKTISIV